MRRLQRLLTTASLGLLATAPTANAQPPDFLPPLAAMTLDASALPTGYALVGETLLSAERVVGDRAGDLDALGFQGQYVSVYADPATGNIVRSYVSRFDSAGHATDGFPILEDEPTSDEFPLADTTDETVSAPMEVSTGTYQAPDGSPRATADYTWVMGEYVVGVAVDSDPAAAPQQQLAADLAKLATSRAEGVIDGTFPAGTDAELPSHTLSLADRGLLMQAGFLSPVEADQLYGSQGSALQAAQATWAETVVFGTADQPGAIVSLAVTQFPSDAEAQAAVEHLGEIVPTLPGEQPIEDIELGETSARSAVRYSSDANSTETDSTRVVFSRGAFVVVVDVRESAQSDAAATAIANAQLTCVDGGSCDVPALPDGFAESQ